MEAQPIYGLDWISNRMTLPPTHFSLWRWNPRTYVNEQSDRERVIRLRTSILKNRDEMTNGPGSWQPFSPGTRVYCCDNSRVRMHEMLGQETQNINFCLNLPKQVLLWLVSSCLFLPEVSIRQHGEVLYCLAHRLNVWSDEEGWYQGVTTKGKSICASDHTASTPLSIENLHCVWFVLWWQRGVIESRWR